MTTPRFSTSASTRRRPSARRSASVVLLPCASRCLHDEDAYSTLLSQRTTRQCARKVHRQHVSDSSLRVQRGQGMVMVIGRKAEGVGQRRSGNQWQLSPAAVLLLYDTLVSCSSSCPSPTTSLPICEIISSQFTAIASQIPQHTKIPTALPLHLPSQHNKLTCVTLARRC